MDVLLGLIGVVVGWGLAYLTDSLRRRREARSAAALVMAELLHNEGRLDQLVELESAVPAGGAVRRLAWDTYGITLLGLADKDDVVALIQAYAMAETAESTTEFTRQSVDDEMAILRALKEKMDAAKAGGRDEELAQLGREVARRAGTNVPQLKQARDGYLDYVRETVIPTVGDARRRLGRHAGLD